MGKSFTGILEKFNSELWYYHIKIPHDISEYFLQSSGSRVVCTLNGDVKHQAALLSSGQGNYFINLNKEIRQKLRLRLGDQVQVELEADQSEYGLTPPEEFLEWIRQDSLGDQYFHILTKGKQRSLIYIMAKPKRSQTRLTKVMAIFEYLHQTEGKLDFRELYDFIKQYQRQNY